MSDVEVRQWSDHVFAAYVFDGDPLGRFVGTEATRESARELGESRCATTLSDVSEQVFVAELGDGRAGVCAPVIPALTPETAGAQP